MRKLEKKAILLILLLVFICFIGKACGSKLNGVYEQELFIRELTIVEQQKIYLYENLGNFNLYKKMVKIANCESNFSQSAVNHKSNDFGLFQINEATWDETATSMGLNYKGSWKDNIILAKYILETQGLKAWSWSIKCHGYK
jgi:hypothetical protein